MNEKKNIDRLFQEKFKDFEVAPNDAVWNRINESLPNKKKKRRVVALWWQIGGVAAAIALLLTIGYAVFIPNNNYTEQEVIVDTEKKDANNSESNEDKNTPSIDKQIELIDTEDLEKLEIANSNEESPVKNEELDNKSNKNNNSDVLLSQNKSKSNTVVNSNKNEKSSNLKKQKRLINNKDNDATLALNNTSKKSENSNKNQLSNDQELKSTIDKVIKENNTAITDNATSTDNEKASNSNENNLEGELTNTTDKESIKEAIAAQQDIIEEEKEDDENRWSIAPNVAPVYFASLGKGSPIHNQYNGNAKSSDINMSYGITGSYAITKRLKVRAGVSQVNLNYATSDVLAFTGSQFASRNAENQGNIKFNDNSIVSLASSSVLNRASTPEVFNAKVSGDLDQRFGFIEIPLELEYNLLDKKFGINVIGGFSTFFLNQNEIYADLEGNTTLIGEANNINNTSFSANFGLGFNYNLSKQWLINLEPQFKYQLNTFNNTSGDFRPFFIGVYTGLSFKF